MNVPWWKAPRQSASGSWATELASDEYRAFLFGEGEPVVSVDPATESSEPVIGIAHQGAMHLVPIEPPGLLVTEKLQAQFEQLLTKQFRVMPAPINTGRTAAAIASEIIERYVGQTPPSLILGGHHQKPAPKTARRGQTAREYSEYLAELRYAFSAGQPGLSHVNCRSVLVEPRTETEQFAHDVDRIGANWNFGPATITWHRLQHVDRTQLTITWPQVPDVAPFEYEITHAALADDRKATIAHVLRDVRFHLETEVLNPPTRIGWEDRPLDMATTVIGYRAFALAAGQQALTSCGQGQDTTWSAGTDMKAACLYYRHPAPAPGCHCGFNCFHRLSYLFEKPDTWGTVGAIDAIGVVQAWGAIEAHGEGFRAEHVRPLALLRFPPMARIESQRHGYGQLGEPIVLEAAVAASGLPVWDALDHRDQLEEFGEAIPAELLPGAEPPRRPGITHRFPPGTVLTECPACQEPWRMEVVVPMPGEALVHCPGCPAPVRVESLWP